jgi:hypothetical protein
MKTFGWRQLAVILPIAVVAFAAGHDWIDGTLISMEVRQYNVGKYARTVDHHLYTIQAPDLQYVVDFGTHKLKTPMNDKLRFVVRGEKVDVMDSDGKEHTGNIEQRIRKQENSRQPENEVCKVRGLPSQKCCAPEWFDGR